MRRSWIVSAVTVCALVAAGPAWATDYDDFQEGDWNVADTWSPSSDYPQSPADTALIDSVKVTVPSGYAFPAIASVTVGGTGELYFNEATTTDPGTTLYLTGGGQVNKDRYKAVEWAGPVVVTGGVTTMHTGRDQAWTFSGAVSSTTSNCTIARVVGDNYNATILTGDNSGFSGIWDVRDGQLKPCNNKALGTGTVTVGGPGATSAKVEFRADETWKGVAGPQAMIFKQNGTLYVKNGSPTVDIDFSNDTALIFDGGGTGGRDLILRDDVLVKDGGMIIDGWGNDHSFTGKISSESANAVITVGGGGADFSGDNTGYTGDYVLNGSLQLWHPLALGAAGTVTVANNGSLFWDVVPSGTVAQPYVVVQAGGTFGGQHAADTDWDITLDGGTFHEKYDAIDHGGQLTIGPNGGTFKTVYGDLTLSGTISGAGKLTCDLGNQGGKQIFANAGNHGTFSGGIDIQNCAKDVVQVTADGGLGSGTVTVLGSGRLRTQPAGGTGSAAISNVPVVVIEGGQLLLNSTETAANVTLQAGGIIQDLSDTTVFDFDNQFHVEAGAIFMHDEVTDDLPAVGQITPDGEGDRYIYKGAAGNWPAGVYTVGTGTSVRGLAAIGTTNLVSGVTIQEATAGGGFDLFAGGPGNDRNNGNFLDLEGAAVSGTGVVTLRGGGHFRLDAGPALTGTDIVMDYRGDNTVRPTGAGALNEDHTLNVHSGLLYMGYRDSNVNMDAFGTSADPSTWGTVNIKDGGTFVCTAGVLDRGKINVEAGGWVSTRHDSVSGAAQWNFQPGSGLVMQDAVSSPTILGTGNVCLYFHHGDLYEHKIGDAGTGVDIAMGPHNRITSDNGRGPSADSGDIVLAAGATEALLTAAGGSTLCIANKVDVPSGTVVIGAAGTFHVYYGANHEWFNWADITQDGDVRLENAGNNIDRIDVQYGRLRVAGNGPVNGAKVHIRSTSGGVMGAGALDTTDVEYTGDGDIASEGSNWMYIRGGTINPGGNPTAGTLDLSARGVSFSQGTGSVQIVLDVVSDGGVGTNSPVAGTDYDNVTSSRWVNLEAGDGPGNVDLTVRMPLPSKGLIPANLAGDTLEVLSIGSGSGYDLDTDPLNSAEVKTDGDPSVGWTGTVNVSALSVTVTDLTWTARKGNANLDDIVDVLDLARLANNFGRDDDDVDWGVADFNLDGAVDVLDLAAIANNFGQSGSVGAGDGGGAPVPEPASLVVLGLGVLALVRRRGR